MVSFPSWKTVRPEPLNLAAQLTEQNNSIYLTVWNGRGWVTDFDGNPQVIAL